MAIEYRYTEDYNLKHKKWKSGKSEKKMKNVKQSFVKKVEFYQYQGLEIQALN